MALRELLLPWDAQPQEAVGINPVWARDCLALVSGAEPINVVNGERANATGAAAARRLPGTMGIARGAGSVRYGDGRDLYNVAPWSGDFTMLYVGFNNYTGGSGNVMGLVNAAVSTLRVYFGEVSSKTGIVTSPSGGSTVNVREAVQNNLLVPRVHFGRLSGTSLTLWRDGELQGTSTQASSNWSDAPLFYVGGVGWTATQQADVFLAGIWSRALSDDEIVTLSANPWQLFEPRRIHVPVAAGGGAAADLATTGNSGTFSGTANSPATATLAATGASGALSASAGTSASAALAATGDSGTLSASAYTPALASLAATGGSGIFVGSAFSEATAALSATGGSGTLSASAGAEASASLAATGGSGTLAADAFVQAVATLAATGVSGSLIASAWTTISATLSATGGSGELTASAGEPVVATRVLSSYRPLPPPADPKDVGRWAMNELLTIARHLADGRDFDLLNTIHAPPSKPREGMVVNADGTNWDPGSGAGRYERVGGAWVKLSGAAAGAEPEDIIVVCSDETTALTTGLAKATFRMPFDMTLQGVSASVTTAPTGAALIVDINDGASSVLSTKLSIDATEKTSATAATPAVISDTDLAEDAEITIDIDQVGSTIAGAGLKVRLRGVRA